VGRLLFLELNELNFTGARAAPGAEPILLTEFWSRMVSAF